MKKFALLAAIAMLACGVARADLDPANLHINGPGGFAQSSGGTDWVTLPSFAGQFTIQDVAVGDGTVSPWNLIIAVPNFTGSLTTDITTIGGTTLGTPILSGPEVTLSPGQDAYVQLGVPGNGLPNSMSFTNFALADNAVLGTPTPTSYGLYSFNVPVGDPGIIGGAAAEAILLGGGSLPAGSVIFAWGEDARGTTISTAFTNAGVITPFSSSVPEPSTLVIVSLAALCWAPFVYWKRRR
jgi:hypothetical protein